MTVSSDQPFFPTPLPERTYTYTKHSNAQQSNKVSSRTMTSLNLDKAHIELLQQVQHELRTPVHGLLGLVDSLRQDLKTIQDRQQRKSLLAKVDSLAGLGERLQNVLDDFRDFAAETVSISSGEGSPNEEVFPEEPVDLGDLLDTVAAEAWSAQVRQIRAEEGEDARLPPPPELILQTETSLRGWKTVISTSTVRRLAHKLISNALRFTTEGYVEVTLSPSLRSPDGSEEDFDFELPSEDRIDRHFIDLVVEDTGEGMTEQFLSDRLFEPFVKADKFKAGAGLSVNLCSTMVRRLGGYMHVSSDKGRGTIVTVKLPVQNLPQRVADPTSPYSSYQLVHLFGFEGYGLQRLAQVISAQLATFGNLYCTSHIQDADFLLLPEEVCFEVEGGVSAILAQAKPGVKIGVLQANEDAGIEYAAFKNGSRRPTFVTRKPFGPRCVANLLRLAEQKGTADTRTSAETVREEHGHLGYTAPVDPDDPSQVLPEGSGKPLVSKEDAAQQQSQDEPCDTTSVEQSGPAKDLKPQRMLDIDEQEKKNRSRGSSLPSGDKLADLVVTPDVLDEVLRAPNPKPKLKPVSPTKELPLGDVVMDDPTTGSSTPIGEGCDKMLTSNIARKAPKFSVLCCEDNPLNMRILTTMLRQCGFDYHQAADGQEAVSQFKKHLPAVTLLDINMPKLMGFEACQQMRSFVSTELDPQVSQDRMFKIVAVTALSDRFHQQRGLECGMDAWFTKPLQMKQLKMDLAGWKKNFDELCHRNDDNIGDLDPKPNGTDPKPNGITHDHNNSGNASGTDVDMDAE